MDKIEVEIQKEKVALSSFLSKIKKNPSEGVENKINADGRTAIS